MGGQGLLTILADLALIGLAARLAYRPAGGTRSARAAALVGAIGLGAIAFWLVGFVPFNSLFAPRPDQLSWAFGLAGLTLLPTASSGSRRAGAGAVVLLTLAWWTKQPAIVASFAAAVWLALSAWRGLTSWKTCAEIVGGVVVLGLLSFGLAAALTAGWSATFLIEIPGDRPRPISLSSSIHDLGTSAGPAALTAVLLWGAAALGWDRSGLGGRLLGERGLLGAGALGIGGALALFVILDAPASVFFRQAVGSTHSQFVGVAWALALLAALGWGFAQRGRSEGAMASAAVVVALFALSEIPAGGRWLQDELDVLVPPKEQRAVVFDQPAGLISYAEDHVVYHPAYPGIGVEDESDMYPGQFNVTGLVRAGRQPGHLNQALLQRRFDLVYPFSADADGGTGRWEDNYFWKLNQVMAAKYQPSDELAPGLSDASVVPLPFTPFVSSGPLVPRPGPDPAPWMRNCFGPFEIGGVSWRIGEGGGFWCRPGGRGEILQLVGTPARLSEIRADEYEAGEPAAIEVKVAAPGTIEVQTGDASVRRPVAPGRPLSVRIPAGVQGSG